MLTVTKAAIKHLTRISKHHNVHRILFSVKGGGCNGLKYELEPMAERPDKLDEMVILHRDLDVIVDKHSIVYLMGTTIDWQDNTMGAGFVFDNPNSSNSCGCGSTFST